MENSIKYINIEDLIPGQFQAHFENIGNSLDDLTNSIKRNGIIVPLVVREKGINQYEIILGNRRYNAAKTAGLDKVPAIVLNVDDQKALDIIISDNIQRKELSSNEEANLYEKELEYNDNNKEIISTKLGIPLNRILSKLKFNEKNNQQPEPKKEINSFESTTNIIQENSSINKDIINLSELNKEERDESKMNNEIINNQNLNTDPSTAKPQTQEPTFGGRFFPSLEDEPTNMNMNQNIATFGLPTPQVQPQSPLIDLTGDTNNTNDLGTQQTPSYPMGAQMNNNFNMQSPVSNMQDIQQEQPNIPNLDALSTGIIDSNSNMITNSSVSSELNNNELIQNSNQELINNSLNDPQGITNSQQNISSGIELSQEQTNDFNTNINPNINTIDNNIQTQNFDSQSTVPNTPSESINYQQTTDIINQEQVVDTKENNKDIIPVVNMIKSLAVNIENLGYKLNISEDENETSYTINIEVEK